MVSFSASDPGTAEERWLGSALLTDARPVDLAHYDRLIVVAAHPDDETLGAGGMIARFARAGRPVTVLLATDGDASHPLSPTTSPERLADIRRAEFASAVAALAPHAHTARLGLGDGDLGAHAAVLASAVRDLAWSSASRSPAGAGASRTLVIAPWVEDGHPDHEAAGASARSALRPGCDVWEYPIWAWHWGDPTSREWPSAVAVQLSDQERSTKARAGARYVSQIAPLSPAAGDEALLRPQFLAHFDRQVELFFPAPKSPDSRLRGGPTRAVERSRTR